MTRPRPRRSSCERVRGVYRQKEIEFPVQVAMSSFMAEKATRSPGSSATTAKGSMPGPGLAFRAKRKHLTEEHFRTESRANLSIGDCSRSAPRPIRWPISRRSTPSVEDAMSGTRRCRGRRCEGADRLDASRHSRSSWSRRNSIGAARRGGPADSVERLRRSLPAGNAPHGAQPAARLARYDLEEPPANDGSSAHRASACVATPRKIPRRCTRRRAWRSSAACGRTWTTA